MRSGIPVKIVYKYKSYISPTNTYSASNTPAHHSKVNVTLSEKVRNEKINQSWLSRDKIALLCVFYIRGKI